MCDVVTLFAKSPGMGVFLKDEYHLLLFSFKPLIVQDTYNNI